MVRVLVGGLVGGVVFFVWGAVSHMLLPIGEMGISSIANEEPVVAAMREQIKAPGFYFVPGRDMSRQPTEAEMAAWTAKYEAGPTAIIIYNPTGTSMMSGRQFGVQILADMVCGFVIAILLSMTAVGYVGRLAATVLVGVFGWVATSLPHWNWYRFPADFTTGEALDVVVGCLIGGAVIAAIVKGRAQVRE